KLIFEMALEDFAAAYGIRFAALRYFNAAGSDPDGELAERHQPETHLIPRALLAAAGRLERLENLTHRGAPAGAEIDAERAAIRQQMIDGGEMRLR
ncbi:UDP-glucose 4-epimerase GalE, partial [Rhizobium leguminosarum]